MVNSKDKLNGKTVIVVGGSSGYAATPTQLSYCTHAADTNDKNWQGSSIGITRTWRARHYRLFITRQRRQSREGSESSQLQRDRRYTEVFFI